MLVPPPGLIGLMFGNSLIPIRELVDGKLQNTDKHMLNLRLCFFWPNAFVEVHNNPDEDLVASFNAYINKITLIKLMCQDMVKHLEEGKGPYVRREFLNDANVNDGFGATLYMTADPDDRTNYCIFEISSCYKKYRYGHTPHSMKKYLKSVISIVTETEKDLVILKEKLDQLPVGKKEDEK
jgi:hypothetical protein